MVQMVILCHFIHQNKGEKLMYKLVAIEEAAMTRFVELENLDTAQIDKCFDDSALKSNFNFEVMKKGEVYDCKILLFGDVVYTNEERTVECIVVNRDVCIGNTNVIEVNVKSNIYYIKEEKNKGAVSLNSFLFKVSRKDLIQVNDIIHEDLL